MCASITGNQVASDLTVGRRKRLKIAIACDPCRSKKIKCDGVNPVCGKCARRFGKSDQCRYTSPNQNVGSKSRMSRKNHVRQQSNPSTTLLRLAPPATSQPRELATLLPAEYPSVPITATPIVPRAVTELPSIPVKSDTEPTAFVDSMNAMVEGQSVEFFGGSSAGSFTGQIQAAIDERMGKQKLSTSNRPQHRPSCSNASTSTPKSRTVDLSNQVLPPRRLADELMRTYWKFIAPLYPFLDRRSWDKNYANIFAGMPIDTDEAIFLSTMNMIFALSTQLNEDVDKAKREHNSNIYFERASDPLDRMIWDSGSVELVQYLLLTAQYLQCTSSPHRTWMVIGSACRIAQSLGLHLTATSDATDSIRQREIYRRLWHGCVLLDRMVSFTHGRPVMINMEVAASVPLPRSSSDLSELQGLTEAAFFVKSAELYEITHELTVSLYPTANKKTKQARGSSLEELTAVVRIDALLAEWEHSIPEHLVVWPSDSNGSMPIREAVILQLRFLHTRILLLRPTLALICLSKTSVRSSDAQRSLQHRIYQQCAQICVETAQSTISLLVKYRASDGTVGLLPAWWYRLYYLFAASTVLIAAKLRPDIFSSLEINQSWEEAMGAFQELKNVSLSAQKCITALHMLAAKVLQTHESENGDEVDLWKQSLPDASNDTPNMDPKSVPFQDIGTGPLFNMDFTNSFPMDFIVDADDLSWLNCITTWNNTE